LWTDDDANWELPKRERAELLKVGPRLLIVCPDASTGLCGEHLRRIGQFLRRSEAERG
jgi:hypothetical protein